MPTVMLPLPTTAILLLKVGDNAQRVGRLHAVPVSRLYRGFGSPRSNGRGRFFTRERLKNRRRLEPARGSRRLISKRSGDLETSDACRQLHFRNRAASDRPVIGGFGRSRPARCRYLRLLRVADYYPRTGHSGLGQPVNVLPMFMISRFCFKACVRQPNRTHLKSLDFSNECFVATMPTKQFSGATKPFPASAQISGNSRWLSTCQRKRRDSPAIPEPDIMRTISFILAFAFVLAGPSMAGSSNNGLPGIGTFSYNGSPISPAAQPIVVAAR